MTAIRDRRNETEPDDISVPWNLRLMVLERRGLPWWGAVALAFGLSLLGALATFRSASSPGFVFVACYFLGCVGAICVVQRQSLFTPMVQAPLIIGVTVPGVVLFASSTPTGDGLSKMLSIGTPLINSFPLMAVTTGVVLAIGVIRIFRERDPQAASKQRGNGPKSTNSKGTSPNGTATKGARSTASDQRKRPATRAAGTRERTDERVSEARRPRRAGESSMPAMPPRARSDQKPDRSSEHPSERRGPTSSGYNGSARSPRGGTSPEDRRRAAGDPSASGRFRQPPPADPRARRQGEPRPPRRQPPPARRPWNDEE